MLHGFHNIVSRMVLWHLRLTVDICFCIFKQLHRRKSWDADSRNKAVKFFR